MPSPVPTSLTLALAEDAASAEPDPSQWILLLAAAGSFGFAVLGALASSSLLVYSPAKLARVLDGSGERLLARLGAHRAGYHALARSLAITGMIAAGLLLWQATSGGARIGALAGFAILTMVFCGVLPGAVASTRAERVVRTTTPLLEVLRTLLHFPIVLPLLTISSWTLRLFRIKPIDFEQEDITEEILAAVEDKATETGLDEEERSFIGNIVDLKDTDACAIMTPRTDVTAFDRNMPLREAVEHAIDAGFSRFPVYEGKVDNIVGVFYAKDALAILVGGNGTQAKVGDHMRKPLFVPESIHIVDLLRQFQTSRVQMAVVLDEYGGTAGLVSIEDVLEEIVGDITDEYDEEEEVPIKVIEAGRVVESSGRVRIVELNEVLPISIPEAEDYDTVAGFVFTSLDRIPKLHESVEIGGVEFEVLEGDDRRIHRLRVTVMTAPTDA